jgi:hypothetical protein
LWKGLETLSVKSISLRKKSSSRTYHNTSKI